MVDWSAPETAAAASAPVSGVLACGDCDHLYRAPADIEEVECARCGGQLADGGRTSFEAPLALAATALLLFAILCAEPLLAVREQGSTRDDFLDSGALVLGGQGFWLLTPAILFFSLVAPGLRLGCLGFALISLQTGWKRAFIPWAMRAARFLESWAMLDVLLLGALVAYSRLRDLVEVSIGPGGYALAALVIVLLALDDVLAEQLVWRQVGIWQANWGASPAVSNTERATCLVCGLVTTVSNPQPHGMRCVRCGAALARRKSGGVGQTWALVLGAATLYIPANLLPVMTVIRFGRTESDTILSGVKALIENNMWPLAAIVFMASIAVPVLKLVGLTFLLLSIHFKWRRRLQDRTRLYRLIEVIGRWSNIDVFMVSILAALVQFGTFTTVRAGPGIIPFALVVFLTMLASRSFDPRLMWDAAGSDA